MDPYSTHLEALTLALTQHPGDALELGCGQFSTPVIRAFTQAHGARFTIASSDATWSAKFSGQCDQFIKVDDWNKFSCDRSYAVALLDNEETTARRYRHLPALLEKCNAVVVHDAEHYERLPGFAELLARTPHQWFRAHRPHTVVLTRRPPPAPCPHFVFVCRSGGEFAPIHANWLARQLSGRVTVLSDFPPAEFPGLNVIALKHGWPGWWAKMELFRPDILTEKFLFIDLDTFVRRLPAAWSAGDALKCPRPFRPEADRLQSGVMMIPQAAKAELWGAWIADPAGHMRNFRGDQDFIAAHATKLDHFAAGEIASFKFSPPAATATAAVVCFHGQPRPWASGAPWVPPLDAPLIKPGASVVLVGNGPSVLNAGLGARIDAFDEVIRFNTFVTSGFEAHVGSKTTLWSTFGRGVLPQDAARPARVIYIHASSGAPAYDPKEIWRIPLSFYNEQRAAIQSATRREGADRTALLPSTGYLVSAWLLDQGVAKIHLAGFDHFSKSQRPEHHYWHTGAMTQPKEHDGEAEAALLAPFIASGRVIHL